MGRINSRMTAWLQFILYFLLFNILVASSLTGVRRALKAEEFKKEHVVSAVKFATNEIRKEKLRNGEINECIHHSSKLLHGSTQTVEGLKYSLELKLTPTTLPGENCSNKISNGVKHLKPEICEVEIYAKPWKNILEFNRFVCLQIED